MDQFFHCTSKKLLTLKNSKKYLSKLAYITLSHRFTDLSCECKNVVQTCPALTLFVPICISYVYLCVCLFSYFSVCLVVCLGVCIFAGEGIISGDKWHFCSHINLFILMQQFTVQSGGDAAAP